MKIVIVIPTYNESQNIGRLIPLLIDQFQKFPQHNFDVLVVDGNSPDGTGQVVKDLATRFKNIHLLLEEKKAGLGAAYIFGFSYALRQFDAEAIVEMDADLQHSPEDFSKMLIEFDKGADYVLGSRYIQGGSIPKEWAFYRKFLSIGGNIFTRIVLGIFNVSDFTTGFKISRVRGFLDKIDLTAINSSGFAYKMDLLFKMHKLGAKIKEVPITFGLRDRGDSKMEKDNAIDSLKVVLGIRLKESQSLIKFLLVGIAGLVTDGTTFNVLRLTMAGSKNAAFIAGLIGMTTTFLLNNYWSFGDRKLAGLTKKLTSFVVYFASSSIPIVFRSWLVGVFTHSFGDTFIVSNIAFFLGITFGLVWNYLVYSRLIWKKDNS